VLQKVIQTVEKLHNLLLTFYEGLLQLFEILKVGKSIKYVADELLVHYVLDGFLVTTLEKFSLCIRLFFLRSLLTLLLLSVLFSELFKKLINLVDKLLLRQVVVDLDD
jgi:hypothetical protein